LPDAHPAQEPEHEHHAQYTERGNLTSPPHHLNVIVAKVIESCHGARGLKFGGLPGLLRPIFIFLGCSNRSDHDLFDRNSLQVSELLTERISFGRDPADDAVCRSQLLRHHVEMAV